MEHKNLVAAVFALSTAYCGATSEFSGKIEGKTVELRTVPLSETISISVGLEHGPEIYTGKIGKQNRPLLEVYNNLSDGKRVCLTKMPYECDQATESTRKQLQQEFENWYQTIDQEKKRKTEE